MRTHVPWSLQAPRGDTEKWTGTVSHAGTAPPLSGATALVIFGRLKNIATNLINGAAVDTFDSAARGITHQMQQT
jgi:hypothetical protein